VNILQLPAEMIAEILSYVPGHHSVSLTCKKFHKISCDTKFVELNFRTNDNGESFPRFLDNGDTFRSLMKSNRRFNRLHIWNDIGISGLRLERLGKVLQRFGNDIKEADIKGIGFPPNIVALLNFMPKLEKINLYMINVHENTVVDEGELKLHKLKKFESNLCSLDALQIFNQLPTGVLEEISLKDCLDPMSGQNEAEVIPKLFVNQRNIKKVTTSLKCAVFLDWSQIKLKSLRIDDYDHLGSKELLEKVLTGQDEMEKLYFYCDNPSLLNPIIKELKSLVELHIEPYILSGEGLPELAKLSKLKILNIFYYLNLDASNFISFLNLTRNNGVEKLQVCCGNTDLSEFTISQLGVNFPNVKELKLESKSSINVINTTLQSFPNLEGLRFIPNESDEEAFIYHEDLNHQKLKKLHIGFWEGEINHDFAKLIGCCTKLEDFSAESALAKGTLKEIFTRQPNLKSFEIFNDYSSISLVTQADIAAVKENGKKLESFKCNNCDLDDGISPEKLQEGFINRFDAVKVKGLTFSWNMEKSSKQP
jgi:hypothetical protein